MVSISQRFQHYQVGMPSPNRQSRHHRLTLNLFLFHFSQTSLLSLRVTLTHFGLSSCERALGLPTSFPTSGLTKLAVKPRFFKSSWRDSASIHLLMLSSSPREVLFACPPFAPWNPPFFSVEFTLSTPCSSCGTFSPRFGSFPP